MNRLHPFTCTVHNSMLYFPLSAAPTALAASPCTRDVGAEDAAQATLRVRNLTALVMASQDAAPHALAFLRFPLAAAWCAAPTDMPFQHAMRRALSFVAIVARSLLLTPLERRVHVCAGVAVVCYGLPAAASMKDARVRRIGRSAACFDCSAHSRSAGTCCIELAPQVVAEVLVATGVAALLQLLMGLSLSRYKPLASFRLFGEVESLM